MDERSEREEAFDAGVSYTKKLRELSIEINKLSLLINPGADELKKLEIYMRKLIIYIKNIWLAEKRIIS